MRRGAAGLCWLRRACGAMNTKAPCRIKSAGVLAGLSAGRMAHYIGADWRFRRSMNTPRQPAARRLDRAVRRAAVRRASSPSISRPAFEQALAEHRAEIAAHRGRRGGADLRQHRRGAGALGRRAHPGVQRLLCAGRRPHQRGAAGDRARHVAAAGPPLQRDLPERGAVRPARCASQAAASLGLTAEQARVLERYHALFRRAGAGLDAAAKERLAEIGERLATLGTDLRPERARRRAGLHAGARTRTISPACRISPAPPRAARPRSAA